MIKISAFIKLDVCYGDDILRDQSYNPIPLKYMWQKFLKPLRDLRGIIIYDQN
jgi:hypothetical protein